MDIQKRKLCRRAAIAGLSLLLFFAAVWVVITQLFFPLSGGGYTVEIPDFRGMDAEGAEYPEWAEVKTEYRYESDVPAGQIFAQNPSAGSVRKLNADRPRCNITVTVSLGEEAVALPDVVGKDFRTAESVLRNAGFAVEHEFLPGAYPEGYVYDCVPKSGEVLPAGSKVTLYVSAGTPATTVLMPDVRGMSRQDALIRLWLSQLSVRDVIEEESDAPEGTVIRQSHVPNTVVLAGTEISITVSAGRHFNDGEIE